MPPIAIVLLGAGATLLLTRPLSVLGLWILVVLLSAVIETVLLAYVSSGSRFSLGWWAGRLYGLTASSIVLLALLSESVTLYVRLARSLIAERRSREGRLTMLEILSASIAHEVNQPLGSMVTNADAALRWLDRPQPDLGETRAALQRIAEDGHRAGKVIDSVRTMFKKDIGERSALNLNALLTEALQRTVEDNGPGLTDVVRRRLFEPFFTTKEHGLGMGLLFCRSVIERHGGRLWADDDPAGGAIFCFTLPADDTAESVAIQ